MKRGDLFALARGTVDAFVGRNNDVGGYWAIGKLGRHALDSGEGIIVFDLLAGTAAPPWEPTGEVCARAAARLDRHLGALRLSRSALRRATVELRFERVIGETPCLRYRCTAYLVDDRGRASRAEAVGSCWPHDPSRERRRGRVSASD